MKYQIILFDADETLFDFKKAEETALENTVKDFGCSYDKEYHLPLYKNINEKMWKDLEEGKTTPEILKLERFRKYGEALNVKIDAEFVSKNYEKQLSEASFPYEESFSVIKELHKNFRLIIITNGLAYVQKNRLQKSILAPYFEDIVISEEVKFAKPDPRIFEIALERAKFSDKSKILMVGDSL